MWAASIGDRRVGSGRTCGRSSTSIPSASMSPRTSTSPSMRPRSSSRPHWVTRNRSPRRVTTALFTSIPPWLLDQSGGIISYVVRLPRGGRGRADGLGLGGDLLANDQFWFTDEEVELKRDGVGRRSGRLRGRLRRGHDHPDTPPADEVYQVSYHHHLPPGIALATATIATDMLGARPSPERGCSGCRRSRSRRSSSASRPRSTSRSRRSAQAPSSTCGPYAAMFASMR